MIKKQHLNQYLDRRKQDRFKIPEAKVSYTGSDGSVEVVPLTDISKSSARFELTSDIDQSNLLEIEVIISSQQTINLKGKIVWISNIDLDIDKKRYAAVHFLPFGSGDTYNSMLSFRQISQLFNKYNELSQVSI